MQKARFFEVFVACSLFLDVVFFAFSVCKCMTCARVLVQVVGYSGRVPLVLFADKAEFGFHKRLPFSIS